MNTLFKTITSSQLAPANERQGESSAVLSEEDAVDFIFIRDLDVEMSVGILDHEKDEKQRVLINIELAVCANPNWVKDDIQNVVSYADVVEQIQKIAVGNHINLLENFAEKIAASCLKDKRVREISVQVEKTDIYDCAGGVGCQIIRVQS